MENNKILKIEIDQNDHNESDDFIRYEREAAVHDLISENLFEINSN